jgi:hypothetical protein
MCRSLALLAYANRMMAAPEYNIITTRMKWHRSELGRRFGGKLRLGVVRSRRFGTAHSSGGGHEQRVGIFSARPLRNDERKYK